jgi:maltose-binding protein MalE
VFPFTRKGLLKLTIVFNSGFGGLKMVRKSHWLTLFALIVASLTLALGTSAQDEEGLVIWADDTRSPILAELGADFEAEYGIPLQVVQLPFEQIRDQMITAAPAGEGPDIIIGAHDWLGQLAVNGLLAPIELDEELAAEFTPASLAAFTWDGELYGLPYAAENVALYRNTDLVPEAPQTWAEVREISEQLVEAGEVQYGYIIQQNDPFHFFGIQTAFGGYVFGQDDTGNYNPQDVGIDNEGSIAALQWLSDMVADELTPPGLDSDAMRALFESGDAAMVISGPWDLPRFRDSGIPFAVSSIPAAEEGGEAGRPFLGVQGFMVSAFSENVDLATAFLTEYVATEETMTALYEAGGRPPAFLPSLEALEDADIVAFGEAGANALAMPAIPEMSAVWSSWGNAMELVVQQQVTAEEAFTTAAEQIRTAISDAAEATPES